MKNINLNLNLKIIKDAEVREALERIQDHIQVHGLFDEFQLFELEFSGAVSLLEISHRLDFVPKDVILTFNNSPHLVTFYPGLFTKDHYIVSANGPCKIRFVMGRFKEGSQVFSAPITGSGTITPGGGGGPGGTNKTEPRVISGSEDAAKKLILLATPAVPGEVLFFWQGVLQTYGVDYTIVGNELRWNGLVLDGLISSGDQTTVHYFY